MCDYKTMYLLLFNAVSDAVDTLQDYCLDNKLADTLEKLKHAQQQCEEAYINQNNR